MTMTNKTEVDHESDSQAQNSCSRKPSAIRYLTQDIRPSLFAELQLVLLTFCTGIQGKPIPFLPSVREGS